MDTNLAGAPARGDRQIVFVFGSHGSQWRAMGRQLLEQEPVFAATIERASRALRQYADWSLERVLSDPDDESWLSEVDIVLCSLWAIQVALAELWRSWGVEPHAIVGHSMGEIAAASAAGVIDLCDGARLMASCGELAKPQRGRGGMLQISLPADEARAAIAGYEHLVGIGAYNSPRATVLSGERGAIKEIGRRLEERGVPCRFVRIDFAAHSPQIDEFIDELRRRVAPVVGRAPAIPMHSTVLGRLVNGAELGPTHWPRVARDTIHFSEVIQGLARDGHTIFLEVSPHPVLLSLIEENLEAVGIEGTVLGTLRRDQGNRDDLLARLRELHAAGAVLGERAADRLAEAPAGAALRIDLDPAWTAVEARADLLLAAVRRLVAGVLRMSEAELPRTAPFGSLGLDSLLGLELRDRLEHLLGRSLPVTLLLRHPTLESLTGALLERLAAPAERPPSGAALVRTPAAIPVAVPDPAAALEPFGLTDLQQAYLIGRAGTFELGNVSTCFFLEWDVSDVDVERLAWSLGRLVARHPMLRAVVLPEGAQRVLPEVPAYAIEREDLRAQGEADRERRLLEVRREIAHHSFDTARWPLFRVRASRLGERRTRLHVLLDALVADGWSLSIVLREWGAIYRGGEAALAPIALTYRDYVTALAKLEHTEAYAAARAYWWARLASLPPPPELPLAQKPSSIARPEFAHRQARLDAAVWSRFKANALRHGVTLSAAVAGAYTEVLAAWSASAHFTLNLLVLNRLPLHPEVTAVVGNFSATSLLEVDLRGGGAFAEHSGRLQHQLWSDLEHGLVTGVRVLRELNRRQHHTGRAGMPVVLASMLNVGDANKPSIFQALGAFGDEHREVHSSVRTPQVWLDHQVLEDAGALVVNWDVVEELFPPGMIADMFAAYVRRLAELADEAAWLAPTPPLLPRAHAEVRAAVNATAAPVREALLHAPFLERAAEAPDRVAVIAKDRTLTYGELDALSDRVAGWLGEAARPDQLVAIVMEKGWEQVVAALGIVKAGAAYVPIDPALPAERIRHLLAHAEVDRVLTQRRIDGRVAWPEGPRRLCVDEADALPASLRPDPGQIVAAASPGDLAYVIYTSGSTGLPKGVMIEHRAALNTILDVNERFGVGPDDRVFGISSLSFDLSVYDIFGTLAAGGALVLPAPEDAREPGRWLELARSAGVTIWSSVPALVEMLIDHWTAHAPGAALPLRLVMMSGDWIPLRLVPRLARTAPNARRISLGGATEAAIWSILHPIEELDPAWTSVPYGTPMKNQRFDVLDDALRPRPAWVPGELYIAGLGLARGYWRDEAKTAASFVVHPQTGERLYRTGDLGRYLPDGSIELLGRADFQVKINGYRVELGEIEAALAAQAGVRAAVAAAIGDRGARRLVAYVVPAAGQGASEQGLVAALSAKLPAYAVPQQVIVLDALPLSANGKVDRRALPEPGARAAGRGAVPARTAIEAELVELWRELLGVREVGIADSFFELGGHSLLAVRLMGQLRTRYGVAAPLSTLFERPTIEHLARLVEARRGSGVQRRDALVALREDGRRPPLFFVHPVGGDVLCYAELARALGPEQPVFGLQALDPADDEDPASASIADLAATYAAAIRARRPTGPYFLGGWSMGGVVAYEIAQRLRRAGEEVALLALVDVAIAPAGARPELDDASLLAAFHRDLAGVAGHLPAELDAATLDDYFARFRRNYRAMLAYQATAYGGPLLFVRARHGGAGADVAAAWGALAAAAEIVELGGDHYAIARREHAPAFAELLGYRIPMP